MTRDRSYDGHMVSQIELGHMTKTFSNKNFHFFSKIYQFFPKILIFFKIFLFSKKIILTARNLENPFLEIFKEKNFEFKGGTLGSYLTVSDIRLAT